MSPRIFTLRKSSLFLAPFLLALLCLSCFSSGKDAQSQRPLIVIVTGSAQATPLEYQGAEDLAKLYPLPTDSPSGGGIKHLVFPDKAKSEGAVAAFLADAASDPKVDALVVEPSLKGTALGFRKAKAARPMALTQPKAGFRSPLCIAAEASDEELDIESSADLVVGIDRLYRAYLVAWEARKLGASSLIAVYGNDAAGDAEAQRERAVMSASAADLGLKYVLETAPAGLAADAFIRSGSGAWLKDNGSNTALYCADGSLAGPLLSGAVAGSGILADCGGVMTVPSCASLLGIDLSSAGGDAKRQKALLEKAILPLGMSGRIAVWDAAFSEATVSGLGEYAIDLVSGKARQGELKDLTAALDARSGAAAWMADWDIDPSTGVKSANRVLLRQDPYVLGSGYLQSALQNVPRKYLDAGLVSN